MRTREAAADLIARTIAQNEAARQKALAAEEEARQAAEAKARKEQERRERKAQPKPTAEEKEALKEKRLQKLISPIVVQCMSKYKKELTTEQFKKYAKEVRIGPFFPGLMG